MLALYCNLCSPEGAFSKGSVGNKSSIIRDRKSEREEVVSERTIMTCGLIKTESRMSSSKETIEIRLCDWTKKKREVEELIEWLEGHVGGEDWSNLRIVIGQKSERVENC